MARLIFFLTALLLAIPAISADDNKGRGNEKKALRADCERQANQQNLIGKERSKFVKECSKEGKHAKRHGKGRDEMARPAPPPPQPATPATPAAPPAGTAPAQPAATPPAATVPAQPATPAPPPPATIPAATPKPPNPVLTAEQKRANCADEAKRTNVPMLQRKQFVDKCMKR